MEPGGMDIAMELICNLAVVKPRGGVVEFSRGSIVVPSMSTNSTPPEEPFIIVRTSSDDTGTKYNLIGNIEHQSFQFPREREALVCLKEPSCNINITKADPDELAEFIIYLKSFLPKDSPLHISLERPIPRISLHLDGQEEYKLKMKNIIRRNTNLDLVSNLKICNCNLELAGDQVPIADAVRKMKNLKTLRLQNIELCSLTFLEIESKELKKLHLCCYGTRFQVSSLFKNDLCYKDSLVELNLDGNRWSEIPNGVFEFRNLLRLSLENNLISDLPDKFINLPNLQELTLSGNRLTHLPSCIFKIENLLRLSLNDNLLTELPDMFTNLPKLKLLMLQNNQLQYLPASIFALQDLCLLYISDNFITELPDIINLPNLKYLFLCNNQLQYLPLSICSLHLKLLSIEANEFDLEIPPSVGNEMHSLKELSYRTILNHNLKVEEGMLPMELLPHMTKYQQCICGCKYVDGHEVSFSCNLSDIILRDMVNHYNPRIAIRGIICNSLQSCFHGRFLSVN